jgi:maltoporin
MGAHASKFERDRLYCRPVTLALLAALLVLEDPSPAATGFAPGLDYGSYGRIGVASDLDGGPGVATNVVSHGSRLEELPYVELDLYYGQEVAPPVRWRVVTTVAFSGDPFHTTGRFDADIALRNLFLQVEGVGAPWVSLWAGSRMYRGDDLYLFDYWPLDNLNLVGAGVLLRPGRFELAFAVGANRLDNDYQFQVVAQPSPTGGPTDQVVTLDRERLLTSAKLTLAIARNWRASLYGEAHAIGQGVLRDPMTLAQQRLPDDHGFVLGAELSTFTTRGWANLFVRAATGLAAYGELAVPFGLATDKRAAGARELVLAAAGGWDGARLGVIASAYARYFQPADDATYSRDRFWEGIVAARPQLALARYLAAAAEVSIQARASDSLDPSAGQPDSASVVKLTAMPAVVTLAPGVLGRPQLRVVYTVSLLDAGARRELARRDARLGDDLIQYLGVQAEWWFNSSYR